MHLEPYRRVLAVPGFRSLALIALVARIPVTATSVTLTLYVVRDLGRGYTAAGAVGAAATIAAALAGPLFGRLIDRHGLRPALILGTVGEIVFWSTAPFLPYAGLLVFAAVAGLIRLPIFSITRQSISVLVPENQRRQAFALDSMGVELSFMIGPALATLMVTGWSGRTTMLTLAVAMAAAGIALIILDPKVRTRDQEKGPQSAAATAAREKPAPARAAWFGRQIMFQFAIVAAATLTLSGSDIAIVARLRETDQLRWAGVVIAVWCAASLIGGFIFGLVRGQVSPLILIGTMCLLTIPVGLGHGWMLLCLTLVPCGLFCAPSLAGSVNAVSSLAPERNRGEIMGWHGASMTLGTAVGAPLSGAVIDQTGPALGFAVVGTIGLLIIVLAALFVRGTNRRTADRGSSRYTTTPVATFGYTSTMTVVPPDSWRICRYTRSRRPWARKGSVPDSSLRSAGSIHQKGNV